LFREIVWFVRILVTHSVHWPLCYWFVYLMSTLISNIIICTYAIKVSHNIPLRRNLYFSGPMRNQPMKCKIISTENTGLNLEDQTWDPTNMKQPLLHRATSPQNYFLPFLLLTCRSWNKGSPITRDATCTISVCSNPKLAETKFVRFRKSRRAELIDSVSEKRSRLAYGVLLFDNTNKFF